MTNKNELEALADEIERNEDWATGVSRDQDKIIIEALRVYARTPMREALERIKKIADAAYANDPKLRADGARALKRIAEQADAALSTLEAYKIALNWHFRFGENAEFLLADAVGLSRSVLNKN